MFRITSFVLTTLILFPTILVAEDSNSHQPMEEKTNDLVFNTPDEAYTAGKAQGYADGHAAGLIAAKKGEKNQTEVFEICQTPPRNPSGSYDYEYDRGYREGYEAGYREGYTQGMQSYVGWGGGFALGFFLGLLGVIIAAVIP